MNKESALRSFDTHCELEAMRTNLPLEDGDLRGDIQLQEGSPFILNDNLVTFPRSSSLSATVLKFNVLIQGLIKTHRERIT